MNVGSIIVLVVIFVLLALAILFICQNGGWQGGCGGNCAACRQKGANAGQQPAAGGEAGEKTDGE